MACGQARNLSDSQALDGLHAEKSINTLNDLWRAMLQFQRGPGKAGEFQRADLAIGAALAAQLQGLAEFGQLRPDRLLPVKQ